MGRTIGGSTFFSFVKYNLGQSQYMFYINACFNCSCNKMRMEQFNQKSRLRAECFIFAKFKVQILVLLLAYPFFRKPSQFRQICARVMRQIKSPSPPIHYSLIILYSTPFNLQHSHLLVTRHRVWINNCIYWTLVTRNCK
jgi:hypothetical protein